jgi:branched-subunit amino acid aminotransferase/4-amino-4-deoxychorismate lyase
VPAEEGFSLYIRPALIGTHPFLGLSPTREAMLFVVLSPVGPYFPSGLKPVKLFVETEVVRAYPGGVGDKKVGGNYAPTMLPQLRSAHRGCAQVSLLCTCLTVAVITHGRGFIHVIQLS